ncbi:MAG: hypothetical protein O9346_13715 [Leptospiraceae bacterium]|nr:hypothetical protein [Leptospiraceae bacterium]MCZ8347467.1 hypothetical protein [Leptospiraceae bacterium]
MKKKLTKPFFIQFIGILFILLPFLNIFQAYWIHNSEFPFFRLTTLLHYFPPYVSLILFFSAPFIGFGILKVKKWAYYGFFIYCSFLTLNNFFQIIKSPRIFEIISLHSFHLLLRNERFRVEGVMLRKIGEKQLGIQFSALLQQKLFH